jgi:hypothetical protein
MKDYIVFYLFVFNFIFSALLKLAAPVVRREFVKTDNANNEWKIANMHF